MNILTIKLIDFEYDNKIQKIAEFFIDSKPLISFIDDYRHLGNCDCIFNPNFDGTFNPYCPLQNIFKKKLLGKGNANNVFGKNRVTIYGCHCGCEDCGILSATVVSKHNTIQWQKLGWEHDEDEVEFYNGEDFAFDKQQYTSAINEYICKAF